MRAIFDTNLFVGGAFNRRSASAQLIEAAREGRISVVWNEATRAETERILRKIPRISWEAVEDLFRPEHEAPVMADLTHVAFVEDPEDRKFAALSLAAEAPVVTSDDDLLAHAERLDVLKPGDFWRRLNAVS